MEIKNYTRDNIDFGRNYTQYSEMTPSESTFLSETIKDSGAKKIVEIGVAAGTSSLLILDTIKNIEDAHLYSIDYSTKYYRDANKNTGFILDDYPELKTKWSLYTGAMSCNFLEDIGKDIDLCFIDTTHCSPGEFLDYLQVLPFMKRNGIIVIHDIAFHTYNNELWNTCCILFSAIKGQKILPAFTEHKYTPNIGAIKLSPDTYENAYDIFNCLTLPWLYKLDEKDYQFLKKHFQKYYDKDLTDIFEKAYKFNSSLLEKENRAQTLYTYTKNIYLTMKYLKYSI